MLGLRLKNTQRIMFSMLGLRLGLTVRVRISVPLALNACKNIKLKLKQAPENNKKNT